MLRKCFLVPVLASLALLALAVDVAQAQRLRERRMERRDSRRGIVSDPYYADPLAVTSMTPGMQMGMTPTVQTTANARISYYPANLNLGDCAQIRVMVPDAQAKMTFDNKATMSMGTDRVFLTPTLPAGAPSNYTVRCTFMQNGQEVTREQVIACTPNTVCVVDFTARR